MKIIFKVILFLFAIGVTQAAVKGRPLSGKFLSTEDISSIKIKLIFYAVSKLEGQGSKVGNETDKPQEREKRHKSSPFEWSWSNPLFGYKIMLLKINGPGKLKNKSENTLIQL